MRLVLVASALLFGSLVACAGQVAPDSSDTSSQKQRAEDGTRNPTAERGGPTNDQNARDQNDHVDHVTEDGPGYGYDPTTGKTTAAPASSCWNYGAPADGECTVGNFEYCDNYQDQTSSSSSGASTVFCKRICVNDGGKAVWSEKSYDRSCAFYDTKWHTNAPGCSCAEQNAAAQSSGTPLVLSFDDAPVVFATNAGGAFDLIADGACHGSDWPTAATPWLALDRNGNGVIDDGSELFGSAVRLADGTRARNGFDALRELDTNHDGVFDASDDAFARVVVWTDHDGDRRSTARELTTLGDAGVRSIALAYNRGNGRFDARGNHEGERASFTMTSGKSGTVIDVYLRTR